MKLKTKELSFAYGEAFVYNVEAIVRKENGRPFVVPLNPVDSSTLENRFEEVKC